MTRTVLHIALFLFICFPTHSQTLIRVLDRKTNEPVSFASVAIENPANGKKSFEITGENGELRKKLQPGSRIIISLLGYNTLIDTIKPGNSLEFYLTPSSVELNEVVVTAFAKPVSRDQSIYKIDMISSRQISEQSSANLEEALNNQLSLRVEQAGSLGSTIRMQGLTGEQVKILVDGVPVIGRVNGNIDLAQVNLENADHIEIIEGPMSVVYGSDAIGGVINIITKENTRKKFTASSELYYETVGRYNANFASTLHLKKHTVSLSASRNFFGGVALPGDPPRAQTWKPYLQYMLDGSYMFVSGAHRLKFSASYFNEDYRINGGARLALDTSLSKNGNFYLKYIANDAVNYTTRLVNTANYTYSADKNSVNVIASYSDYERILNTYSNDLSYLVKTMQGVVGQDTQKEDLTMVRAIWANTSLEHFQLMAGTDFNYDFAEDKADFGTKDIIDLAGFMNLQYAPSSVFSFQPGVRFMYNSRFSAPVVYSFNMKYNPGSRFSARASVARGFRAPSLKELFFSFTQLDHDVHGNPLLKPEYSNNVNAALNYKVTKERELYNLELTAFFNQMKNKIDYLTDPNDPLKATLINLPINSYKNFGSNFIFTYQFRTLLSLQAGTGFTAVSTLGGSTPFFYSPNVAGSISYMETRSGLRWSLYYKYFGKFVMYTAQEESNGKMDIAQETIAGGYHSMNAQVSRSFLNGMLQLSLGVKNIFNNTVVKVNNTTSDNAGLVGYGRSSYFKLDVNFESH